MTELGVQDMKAWLEGQPQQVEIPKGSAPAWELLRPTWSLGVILRQDTQLHTRLVLQAVNLLLNSLGLHVHQIGFSLEYLSMSGLSQTILVL